MDSQPEWTLFTPASGFTEAHRLRQLLDRCRLSSGSVDLDCSDLTPKEIQELRGLAGRFTELLLEAPTA